MLLMFISQYYAYTNLKDLSSQNDWVNNTIRILTQTANFGLIAKESQSNIRGYIITGNDSFLESNKSLKTQLVSITDTLYNLVGYDSRQTERVTELLGVYAQIVSFSQELTDVYRVSGMDSAATLIKTGAGVKLFSRLRSKVDEIEYFENEHLNQRKKLAVEIKDQTILLIIATGIAGFIITSLSVYFILLDRRKQKELKREIYRKERMLSQYLEAIPDGVLAINTDKKIVMFNQSGKDLLGVGDFQSQSLDGLFGSIWLEDPEGDKRYNSENLSLVSALGNISYFGRKTQLRVNDKIVTLESNIRPISDYNGEIIGAISVFRDVTDKEVRSKALRQERDFAEKSAFIKDVFLANMSHEIRTPLNAILGFTYLLESEALAPVPTEYVNNIKIAGRNLLNLINDILDLSKLEAGEMRLDKEPTSLRELVDSVNILLQQKANEKHIDYYQELHPNLPKLVVTDKLRLTQILLNICGNAVKFTEKGSVTVKAEPMSPGQDKVQTIRFSITDTGIGIPKEKIQKIFDRFVQASESTTRKFGGTGLGLSISKSLIQLLGGTLNVTSIPGQGTSFVIDFPFEVINETDSKDRTLPEPSTQIEPQSLKILAAEDNLLNQKLLIATFRRFNLPLTIVNNGLEAIEALLKEKFDLILMDIQMPEMDGYTAIRKIRKELRMATPIITMTAHAMVGEKEECLRIGANSYISKPFRETELLSEITRLTVKNPLQDPVETVEAPPSYTSENTGLIDKLYLEQITGGDKELLNELKDIFEADRRVQLGLIKSSLETGNYTELKKTVHRLRSSLISVGMLQTADDYKKIEAALGENRIDTNLNDQLNVLADQICQGLDELKSLN